MMEATTSADIQRIYKAQREYFRSGETLGLDFRKEQLRALRNAIIRWEKPLYEALWEDLHKSYEESFMCETSMVLGEIRMHLRRLSSWAKAKRVPTPLKLFPSCSRIISRPLGNTLIISPWNYPVQLLLNPLVGAISSGCTAVLKCSPKVPKTSGVIAKMISSAFPEKYIAVTGGGREVNTELLGLRWDLIFFTGSPSLGRVVMSAAARNLTPVILELGGKSPCIVDRDADIRLAAKRIAWGKCLNAGQTCVAPDYLLVHKDIRTSFTEELARQFRLLLGEDMRNCRHYARIVDDKAFGRIESYLGQGDIVCGGDTAREERFIAPTILDNVSSGAPVMQEEIFGPVLPLLQFGSLDEAVAKVNSGERPLALYYFGKEEDKVLKHCCSGGCCINDCIMHLANENLPFGGVGNSGMGSYHGKNSFDAFSHKEAVLRTPARMDMPFRYMPYKWFKAVKKLM